MPDVASFEALKRRLATQCRARRREVLRGHSQRRSTSGWPMIWRPAVRFPRFPLSPARSRPARVSSTGLVRYRVNDYSVPTRFAFAR